MKLRDDFHMGSRTDIVIHRIRVAKEDLATVQLLVTLLLRKLPYNRSRPQNS